VKRKRIESGLERHDASACAASENRKWVANKYCIARPKHSGPENFPGLGWKGPDSNVWFEKGNRPDLNQVAWPLETYQPHFSILLSRRRNMFHPDQKSIGMDELMLIRKELGARI
jgi:hypothetical protein